MPSHDALARRVKRLARSLPVNRTAEWRAFLAECFAAPEYDSHRAAIIEALCSDMPQYHFSGDYDGARAFYLVSWWARNLAPVVRVYPGDWGDAI